MNDYDFDLLCLEHMGDLICLYDAAGEIIKANAAALKITGYTPQELEGKNIYSFYMQEGPYTENNFLPGPEGLNAPMEHKIQRKDGEFVWVQTQIFPTKSPSDNPLHVSVCTDISKLKAIEEELNRNEVFFHEASKMAVFGAWEADVKTGKTLWSQVMYDIYEVGADYTPSFEKDLDFFTGEAKEIISVAFNNAVYQGTPFDLKLPFTTARGNRIWIRAIGKPEVYMDKTIKLYGVFQDITPEIETRRKLNAAVKQLTGQKNQLQEFNQIVSHNLRSPVAGIGSLVDLLQTSDSETEKNELFITLKQVAELLRTQLDELVDAVKVLSDTAMELEPISLETATENVKKLLEGNIKELNATVITDFAEWDTIHYPKIYMESILLNLMSNALKYSLPGRNPMIQIKTSYEEGKKIITFSDNGSGIDLARYGEKIFKLHTTFHREKPGKGLGLFMTKNQVEALGGEISIESNVDEGTAFKINFNNLH